MSILKTGLLTFLIVAMLPLWAQEDDWRLYRQSDSSNSKSLVKPDLSQQATPGSVKFFQDERIALMDSLKKANPSPLDGYRVQLFFGTRNEANKMRVEFLRAFPEVGAYVTYLAPNFRLRVGDFRTRAEAEKFKREVGQTYQGAYIVADQISLPPLPAK